MRVLEASYFPRSRQSGPVIRVARIYCDGMFVVVEPLPAGAQPIPALDPTAALAKLNDLVEHIGPDTYERLRELRGDYWSFDAVNLGI